MNRFDSDKIDDLIDLFADAGFNQSPISIAVDSYTGLLDAGFTENEALRLTEIICSNFYRALQVRG